MLVVTGLVLIATTLGSMAAEGHFKAEVKTTVTIEAPTKIEQNITNKVNNKNTNTVKVIIPESHKEPKEEPVRKEKQQPKNQEEDQNTIHMVLMYTFLALIIIIIAGTTYHQMVKHQEKRWDKKQKKKQHMEDIEQQLRELKDIKNLKDKGNTENQEAAQRNTVVQVHKTEMGERPQQLAMQNQQQQIEISQEIDDEIDRRALNRYIQQQKIHEDIRKTMEIKTAQKISNIHVGGGQSSSSITTASSYPGANRKGQPHHKRESEDEEKIELEDF